MVSYDEDDDFCIVESIKQTSPPTTTSTTTTTTTATDKSSGTTTTTLSLPNSEAIRAYLNSRRQQIVEVLEEKGEEDSHLTYIDYLVSHSSMCLHK